MRSVLFDGVLNLNASVFFFDYKCLQIPIPNVPTDPLLNGGIQNAAEPESKEIKLSLVAIPVAGLTLLHRALS